MVKKVIPAKRVHMPIKERTAQLTVLAISLAGARGMAACSRKAVAEAAGIVPSAVNRVFPTVSDMHAVVFDAAVKSKRVAFLAEARADGFVLPKMPRQLEREVKNANR